MERWEKVETYAAEFMRELIRAGSIRCPVEPSLSKEPPTESERAASRACAESAFLLAEEFVREQERRAPKGGEFLRGEQFKATDPS